VTSPRWQGSRPPLDIFPPVGTHSVGGDWYEGLLLDGHRIALVVGDVTGHGVAAAADMALIRGMVTALLHSGVSVASVFSEVSGVLRQRPGLLLATAALAVVDVGAATLTFATAGHPPPVLRLPDGRVQILDNANAPIIGH
jgi:chemotaxis family two-component system sensor kinase Cph1